MKTDIWSVALIAMAALIAAYLVYAVVMFVDPTF